MTREIAVRGLRAVLLALVVSAEVFLAVQLGDRFAPANHFSYFTVLSNCFGAVVAGLGAARRVPGPIRGAAVVYLVVTGLVYAAALRDVDVSTPAYANLALHVLTPVIVAVDWLLDPPARPIAVRQAAWWLAFPVAYLAYTLLRGSVVGWYPYPFLDPAAGGYRAVAAASLGVAAVVVVVAWVVRAVGNRLTARPMGGAPQASGT